MGGVCGRGADGVRIGGMVEEAAEVVLEEE